MQYRTSLPLALALLSFTLSASAGEASRAACSAAAKAAQSVVFIDYVLEKQERGFSGQGQRLELAATGSIVTEDGLIVLSGSIFPEDPNEQREPAFPTAFDVRLSGGERLPAELLGRSKDPSLTFLKLKAEPGRKFAAIDFADAAPLPRPGDALLLTSLLPEKYGRVPTFMPAMVGAVVGTSTQRLDVDVFVQDSMIGAPAFDAQGRLVGLLLTDPVGDQSGGVLGAPLKLFGVLTRGKEPGFPLVVPAAEIAALVARPPQDAPRAAAERAWLGVTLQPVPKALASYWKLSSPTGILVTSVWKGSPAEKAGLLPEDLIVSFDGRDVSALDDDGLTSFIDRVRATPVGKTVAVRGLRKLERINLQLTLAASPQTSALATEYRNATFGIVAQNLTLDVALSRGWPEDTKGVLISDLETAGLAQVGGLQEGDLILEVRGSPVADVEELEAALEAAEAEHVSELIFFVLREPDTLFVPVKTNL